MVFQPLDYVPYNRTRHLERVCALGEQLFTPDYQSQFRDVAYRALSDSIIVQNKHTIVGFALLQHRAPPGLPKLVGLEVAFLGVNPDFQGLGIGSALLRKVKDLNYTYTWLEVEHYNFDAERLYRKHGFETWRYTGTIREGGYVLGYSTIRHELLQRLRSHAHLLKGDTHSPLLEPQQTCSTPPLHSLLHSGHSLPHFVS